MSCPHVRYIQLARSAEEIVAKLPADYFAPDADDLWADYKKGKIDEIAKIQPGMAHGDYSIPPSAASLSATSSSTNFDESPEGKYRRFAAQSGKVQPEMTCNNQFVEKAMKESNNYPGHD